MKIFADKAAAYTQGAVNFTAVQWTPDVGKTVIQQVGAPDDGREAAYDNGGALNPVWASFATWANDGQVQLQPDGTPRLVAGQAVSADLKWSEWPKGALARLQMATDAHLEFLKGGSSPSLDQQAYAAVLGAIRAYMADIHYKWKPNKFEYPDKACPQPMPL